MQLTSQVEQELADTMGRISGAPSPSDVLKTAPPPRTPSRPLASSLFAVRRGRQPLDLEEAGSAAAYVTAANEFLTASGNVLGNATRHHQEGEGRRVRPTKRFLSQDNFDRSCPSQQVCHARVRLREGSLYGAGSILRDPSTHI